MACATERLYRHDGGYYCKTDFLAIQAKLCTACGQAVLGKCFAIHDENYHPDCFKCTVCATQLQAYLCVHGNLRCQAHLKDPTPDFPCGVCKAPVKRHATEDDKLVCAAGLKVHTRCLKCGDCGKALTKATTRLKGDHLPSCTACVQKRRVLKKEPSHVKAVTFTQQDAKAIAAKPRHQAASSWVRALRCTAASEATDLRDACVQGGPIGDSPIQWQKGSLIGTGAFGKVPLLQQSRATRESRRHPPSAGRCTWR